MIQHWEAVPWPEFILGIFIWIGFIIMLMILIEIHDKLFPVKSLRNMARPKKEVKPKK